MERLLSSPPALSLIASHGRPAVKRALRAAIASGATGARQILAQSAEVLDREFRKSLLAAVNATGILLHTNLGRAPLPSGSLEAAASVAGGYSTLEYDLSTGARGKRQRHARGDLCDLFGAEDALVVNNNAAGLFLAVSALARGRRVLVSRGELVAIGGSFKIPEILEAAGASLAEVGTTNRTTIADYRRARDGATALLLTVHPSNYEIRGFTSRPAPQELAGFAREFSLPWLHDQGTGGAAPLDSYGVPGEPTVQDALASGADLVTCSGDKLLGGPQAGLVLGRRDLIEKLASHPIARVVRPDKLTLAALLPVLELWRTGRHGELPIYRAAAAPLESLEKRGDAIRRAVAERGGKLEITLIPSSALFGGGTSPEKAFPSRALAISHPSISCESLLARLRSGPTPVIGRAHEGRALLDLRTIAPAQDPVLIEALAEIARSEIIAT
jgi:L-seryl-tRNA(Ser) seleniumtransferase